jgi:hypothetical protein
MTKHVSGTREGGLRLIFLFGTVLLLANGAWGQSALPLYGPKGISAEAVRQGGLGSCYFHASIAAEAHINPGLVRQAIQQTGEGLYRVTFATGIPENVRMADVQYARDNDYDRSDGLWVAVLLRAYGQATLRAALLASIEATTYPEAIKQTIESVVGESDLLLDAYDRAIRLTIDQTGTIDVSGLGTALDHQMDEAGLPLMVRVQVMQFLRAHEFVATLEKELQANGELFGAYRAVGQGGLPGHVLAAFGGKVSTVGTILNAGDIRPALRRVHAGTAPAIAATRPVVAPKDAAFAKASAWWVAGHAYTVLDYDEGTDTVTLRNPWASHPAPDGTFELPVGDFLRMFEYLDISSS